MKKKLSCFRNSPSKSNYLPLFLLFIYSLKAPTCFCFSVQATELICLATGQTATESSASDLEKENAFI